MEEASGAAVVPEPSSSMEFVLAELSKDPNISFADVRDRAALHGLTIYPIVYGRAKGLLGLVPTAPRGQGKQARAAAAKREVEHGPVEHAEEPMRAEPVPEPIRELPPEQPAAQPTSVAPVRPRRRRQQAEVRTTGLAGDRIEDALGELLRIAEERDRYRALLEEIRRTLDDSLE